MKILRYCGCEVIGGFWFGHGQHVPLHY